jgi:hypothetical protein
MERPNQDSSPRNEVDILLAIARRLEGQGDAEGAINSYQLAVAHMAEDDPRRAEVQARIGDLEQRRGTDQMPNAPEAPIVVKPMPRIPPEPMPPRRPTVSVPAQPQPAERATKPDRNGQLAREERTGRENQRIISPLWSWLFMGCAVLLGLLLPVIVGLFFLQGGLPTIPGVGARAAVPTAAAPTATVPSAAQRAPTPIPTLATTATPAAAATAANSKQGTVLFEDNFNRSALDGSKWIVDNSSNTTVDLSQGTLRLSSSSSHYPYIHSRVNPFPAAGDFRLTVRFQYTIAGACGVPVAAASYVLPAGLSHADTDRLSSGAEANGISIWFWRTVAYYRAGSVREDISLYPLSGWHTGTVDYVGGAYRLAIDTTPIYTSSQTTFRPAVVWLGAPFDLGSGNACRWDSLEVSNIRVESLR